MVLERRYVFTSASVHAGIPTPPTRSRHPPGSRYPLGADTPRQTPPGVDTPQKQTPSEADTPRQQTPQSKHPPEQLPPLKQTPLGADTHLGADIPPEADTPRSRPPEQKPPEQTAPPPPGADSGIRSMSGRYASYWSAFLLTPNVDKK